MPTAPVHVVRQRLRQGVAALLTRSTSDADALAGSWLAPGEQALFRRLAAHDRAHAARTARRLLTGGQTDRDLMAAALLHDVAKAGTLECPGRVRLPDRVLRVVLGRVAPTMLAQLAADRDRPLRRGLHLAVHHARFGAVAAARAGSSERTCWLIAHHECRDRPDVDLRQLIAADDAAH